MGEGGKMPVVKRIPCYIFFLRLAFQVLDFYNGKIKTAEWSAPKTEIHQ